MSMAQPLPLKVKALDQIVSHLICREGFFDGSEGKESACNAGDQGLIPSLGRSLEKGMATHSSILVWRISWTEEPGGL